MSAATFALAIGLASGGAGFEPGAEARVAAEVKYVNVEAVCGWQTKIHAESGKRYAVRAFLTTPGDWFLGIGLGGEHHWYQSYFPGGYSWEKSGYAWAAEAGYRSAAGRFILRHTWPDTTENKASATSGYVEYSVWHGLGVWVEFNYMRYSQAGERASATYGSTGVVWRF